MPTNSGLPIIVGLNEVVAISCVFGFLSMNNNTNSPSVGSDEDPMKHLGYVLGDIERVVENC
jgi:hypothetical protein